MKTAKYGVFVFDTRLDTHWVRGTTRNSAEFWKTFCSAADWRFAYERVHSVADLRYFLEERHVLEPVIIFSGHGTEKTGWQVSNGEYFASHLIANDSGWCPRPRDHSGACKPFTLHPRNRGKTVIFAACEVGLNEKLCVAIKAMLQASAVVAYTDDIFDELCILGESQLTHLMSQGLSPKAAAAVVIQNMDHWKALVRPGKKRFPMVCY